MGEPALEHGPTDVALLDDTIRVTGRHIARTDTGGDSSGTGAGSMSTLPFLNVGWSAWEIEPATPVSP